jgi:hypothetical protein
MSDELNIPAEPSEPSTPTLADKSGLPEFDASKYGLNEDFGKEGNYQDDEVEDEGEDLDEVVDDVDTEETDEEEPFILDDIDLSNIPKELRRDTLKETLEAIDEARKAETTAKEKTKSELDGVKNLLKEEGYDDSYVAQYHKQLNSLDEAIEVRTKEAKAHLQAAVDSGQMTEAQANFEFGQYKSELKGIREKHASETYNKTNYAIVENFITQNEEVLQNPVIQEAAKVLLTDIISDGNIVDTERSMKYLSLGKKIADEAYKAGLAASKQATENQKTNNLKKQVSNPQAKKGASSPRKGGIPYTSVSQVPDKVWNENAEVRNYFLKQEVSNGMFGVK